MVDDLAGLNEITDRVISPPLDVTMPELKEEDSEKCSTEQNCKEP